MVGTAHVYQIDIAATPEEVWRAITDSEWTKRYFHSTPGQSGRFVQTWHVLYDAALAAEPPGRVEWTVEGVGESLTRVRLVHDDLAYSPLTWVHVKDGWVWVIDALKTLLETGKSLPGPEVVRPSARRPRATGTGGRASRRTMRCTSCLTATVRRTRTRPGRRT